MVEVRISNEGTEELERIVTFRCFEDILLEADRLAEQESDLYPNRSQYIRSAVVRFNNYKKSRHKTNEELLEDYKKKYPEATKKELMAFVEGMKALRELKY